jgi:hypothetical protein
MATRNYQQARRSREAARKQRQQEKLQRKMGNKAATPAVEEAPVDVVVITPTGKPTS